MCFGQLSLLSDEIDTVGMLCFLDFLHSSPCPLYAVVAVSQDTHFPLDYRGTLRQLTGEPGKRMASPGFSKKEVSLGE